MPFDTTFSEYVYDYSSNKAEIATGGVRMNMIPKEGGNAFSGSFYGNFGHSSWLANNIDEELIARGIAGGKDGGFKMDQSWQVAPALGGPFMTDRLWFFAGYSYRRASFFPAGLFKSADTSALTYVPNINEPSLQTSNLYEGGLRLTWRATGKDKVQAYYNYSHTQQYPALAGAELFPILVAPEAGIEGIVATHIYQISWVRPHTNRLLFEAGYGAMPTRTDLFPLDAVFGDTGDGAHFGTRSDLPGLFEISDLTVSRNIGFLGNGSYTRYDSKVHQVRASMSYVTGSHNVKVGFNSLYKSLLTRYRSNSNWTNAATFSGRPVFAYFESRPASTNKLTDLGIYAQDQWKTGRLTVNAGLRFDYSNNSYPDHVSMPGAPTHSVWVPQVIRFPGATAAIWKDLQPRLGVVYDLAGDGRTALKAAISRFGLQDAVGDIAGQLNPIASNRRQTRSWFDGATSHPVFAPRGGLPACIGPITCIPGDGLPQGDPLNPNPNGELLSATNNPAFGTPQITQFYDPDWAFGWGVKQANWETSAGVQHQLLQNVSVDVGYFRRTYVNLDAWDNRSVGVEDFDTYIITVPRDPRLPGGGGYPLTLVDLKPTANLVQNNFRTNSETLGGVSEVWHGVDINFSARLEGVLLQGGVATGRRTLDYCAHQAAQPEVLWGDYNSYPASRVGRSGPGQLGGIAGSRGSLIATDFCRAEENWLTNVSVAGSYTFPYGIAVSAAFFSRPRPRREAMYAVPAADVAAALGRPATIPGGVVLNVIPPGTVFGDRLTQVDLRFAKVLERGLGGNLRASLDVYNLFNENAVARERLGFSPSAADSYLVPIGVQRGRLFKISVHYNF